MNSVGKPDPKIAERGGLPVAWRWSTLGEMAQINPPRTRPESDEAEVSFLAMGDVTEDGRIFTRQTRRYSDVAKGFTSFIDKDVLVAKITPCFENGKGALVAGLLGGLGFGSTEFHVVRARQDLASPEFLHLHTCTEGFRKLGERSMVGSAGQKRVPTEFLRAYPVALPSLPEQERITAILTAVDDKLDVIARQVQATQTLKQGLMQTLLSKGVGTEFAEGRWVQHTEFQETELGQIPARWEVISVDSLGELKNGINKAKEDFGHGGPFVNLMDVFGKTSIQPTVFGLVATSEREREDFSLKEGDFLFIRSSVKPSGVGLAALVETELSDAVYSGFLIRLRPERKGIVSRFLMHFFASHAFRKCLLAKSTISANTNINQRALGSLPVAMPGELEQRYIADVLDAWDKKIHALVIKKIHYQTLKRGLMQKLLTGEWRVKVDAEMAA